MTGVQTSVCIVTGHIAYATNHPAVPAGARPARTNVAFTAVFRHPARPGPTQQVRIVGAVSARLAARPQTTAGEMAQGG